MHEGCLVALKRLQASASLDNATMAARQQVLLVAQPDLSTCGQVAATLGQAFELMLRVYSFTVQSHMQQLAGAGKSAVGGGRGGVQGRGPGPDGRNQGRAGGGRVGARSTSMEETPVVLQNKVGTCTVSCLGQDTQDSR
jgi:hypothetical protein